MTTLPGIRLPSDRRFGITLALVLGAAGIYGFVRTWTLPSYGLCLLLSAAFGVAGIVAPELLGPLNRAWLRLGELMGRVVNPIVLGVIFFGLLTPVALVTRLRGRDELRLRRPSISSYWIERDISGLTADSFRHQF